MTMKVVLGSGMVGENEGGKEGGGESVLRVVQFSTRNTYPKRWTYSD